MTDTRELIELLVRGASPVRRLRPPLVRAACWLLFIAGIFGLLTVGYGLRPDIHERLGDANFLLALAASVATAVLAAIAAFFVSLPDRSRLWLLLPAPALVLWLSGVGYQCLTDWVSVAPGSISFGETARCFATLVLISVPASLILIVMLRHAAFLRPTVAAFTGSLAVAAACAVGVSLLHKIDATAMILMWHAGMTALLVLLGTLFGPRVFNWASPRSGLRGL